MKSLDKPWNEYDRKYSVKDYPEIKHYWWRDCYSKINDLITKRIPLDKKAEILECGCGTGNSFLLLSSRVRKVVLLDYTSYSLECAKTLAGYYKTKNAEFVKADVFKMPFQENSFDFCWNIGLIEHYNQKKAEDIIIEMTRVTKNSGYICIRVPNFASLAIKKAKFLSYKYLQPFTFWITGYRLADEHNYNTQILKDMMVNITRRYNVKFEDIHFDYAGSFLPIETPFFIYKTVNKYFPKKLSFLLLLTARVKK